MDRMLWLLLGLIGATLVILFAFGGDGMIAGLPAGQFASVAYLALIAAFLVSGKRLTRGGMANGLRNGVIWLAVLVALMAVYRYSETARALFNG